MTYRWLQPIKNSRNGWIFGGDLPAYALMIVPSEIGLEQEKALAAKALGALGKSTSLTELSRLD